jgi:hypothetical protein
MGIATRMLSLSLKTAYLAVSRDALLEAMALTLSCNRLLLHLSPIRKTQSLRRSAIFGSTRIAGKARATMIAMSA